MSVPAAYVGVILIWSTTPLAIKWSTVGTGFLFGVTGRMVIGLCLASMLVALWRLPMKWHRRARKTYLAAGLGIYTTMITVYWSSQFIPSGWISILFGLTPIVTGVMAANWLGEKVLTPAKLGGMVLGLTGLMVVFYKGSHVDSSAWMGICGIVVAVVFYSASGVWVKQINAQLHGLVVTTGGLAVSVLLFLLTWFLTNAEWPREIEQRTGLAILYLGVIGSVLGFALYFFVLKKVSATRVALITLMTPVIALILGNVLNNEPLTLTVGFGTGLILSGLALFEFGERRKGILESRI